MKCLDMSRLTSLQNYACVPKVICLLMFLLHVQMLVYEFMPNGSLRDWLSGMKFCSQISSMAYVLYDLTCPSLDVIS